MLWAKLTSFKKFFKIKMESKAEQNAEIQNAPLTAGRKQKIFFIEGNIGSGKSTTMEKLQKKYSEHAFVLEPVSDWQDVNGHNLLDMMYKDPSRNAYMFQTFAFVSRLVLLKQALKTGKDIICERSIFTDKEIFVQAMYNKQLISKSEYDVYNRVWTYWLYLVAEVFNNDINFIYIRCEPKNCIEHIYIRNRKEESGIKLDYLETLHSLHDSIYATDFMQKNLPGSKVVIIENNGLESDFLEKVNLL